MRYEKPYMAVIILEEDMILTSGLVVDPSEGDGLNVGEGLVVNPGEGDGFDAGGQ